MQAKPLVEYDYITGVIEATNIISDDRLKISIVGKPKSGKSWFAVSGPKPTLVYDFDDRKESLAGKEGVLVKTSIDLDQTKPTAMKGVEADLSTFKYRKSQGLPIPATYVFDTVSNMFKCMENELFSQEATLYRKIKLTPTVSLRMRNGWDAVNGVEGYLRYIISEFSQLGNLIFVWHSRPEKDQAESTKEKTVYTEQITVDPQFLSKVLSVFNEVYRIEIDQNNNYLVTCKASYDFTASTTLLIDANEPPDIMALIEKHKKRLAEKKGA